MDYAWEWLISAPQSGAYLGKTRGLEELELQEPLFFPLMYLAPWLRRLEGGA